MNFSLVASFLTILASAASQNAVRGGHRVKEASHKKGKKGGRTKQGSKKSKEGNKLHHHNSMKKKKGKKKGKKGSSSNDDSSDDMSSDGAAGNGNFLTARMGPYPGSTDEVSGTIAGVISLRFNPGGMCETTLDLTGLLPGCTNCGAHVHVGTSCEDASAPGGHYWDKEQLGHTNADDPWNRAWYNATMEGVSTSNFYIKTGFNMEANEGDAVVVHTAGGGRVGCGLLEKT